MFFKNLSKIYASNDFQINMCFVQVITINLKRKKLLKKIKIFNFFGTCKIFKSKQQKRRPLGFFQKCHIRVPRKILPQKHMNLEWASFCYPCCACLPGLSGKLCLCGPGLRAVVAVCRSPNWSEDKNDICAYRGAQRQKPYTLKIFKFCPKFSKF